MPSTNMSPNFQALKERTKTCLASWEKKTPWHRGCFTRQQPPSCHRLPGLMALQLQDSRLYTEQKNNKLDTFQQHLLNDGTCSQKTNHFTDSRTNTRTRVQTGRRHKLSGGNRLCMGWIPLSSWSA